MFFAARWMTDEEKEKILSLPIVRTRDYSGGVTLDDGNLEKDGPLCPWGVVVAPLHQNAFTYRSPSPSMVRDTHPLEHRYILDYKRLVEDKISGNLYPEETLDCWAWRHIKNFMLAWDNGRLNTTEKLARALGVKR